MLNLKNKSLFFIFMLISGCQNTQSFRMKPLEKEDLHIVETNSNRVIQECYFFNAEKENNWRHQYILYLLNEDSEVIPVYNPTNQGKPECLAHLKKVKKILKNSSRIKLCVRDKLEKVESPQDIHDVHDFGSLGKYKSSYHALTFDSICNSKECYGISDTWIYTCPDLKK